MELNTQWFTKNDLAPLLNSTIGIERESLRVQPDGKISPYPHSKSWGTRSQQPYIQTDFAESQLELITPPTSETEEVMDWLAAAHQIVAQTNDENDDLLWPISSPAIIPEDRSDVSIAQLTDREEYKYRAYLADIYGKDVQLLSGIHYNFQLHPATVRRHAIERAGSEDHDAIIEETNKMYMSFGRKYFRYRWLLTYLIGGTTFIDDTYSTALFGKPHTMPMRSIRQSRYGYQNDSKVSINYQSLSEMVESIEKAVNNDLLSLEKELYRDLRFRGAGLAKELLTNGIQYMEIRNIDINPYAPYGIDAETIDLIRLFLLTLPYLPEVTSDAEVEHGFKLNTDIAEAHPLALCPYNEEGTHLLDAMAEIAQAIYDQRNIDYRDLVKDAREKLADPNETLAGRLITDCPTLDKFTDFGLDLANQHQATYMKRPYNLHGFENFELSSQDLLKEAIKIGIKVDIIDSSENLVKLSYKDHVEYVRNGNMTGADTLISYFLMENKVATKALLSNEGISVPEGVDFNNQDQAKLYYSQLPDHPFVVKPKNTNYGLGISIFKDMPDQAQYEKALDIAFNEDDTVLIETFIAGTELRFYVQDNKVQAVCERQPAQVIGDGDHTVAELMDTANEHPMRGKKHFAPMTWLEQGETEALQLSNQDLTFDSVPAKDQVVYLRENSNVSTGGLSIDRTDDVHPDYIEIAEKATSIMEANFSGVDIIIDDYTKPIEHGSDYSVLEANFNPNIAIHRFVGKGKPRYLGRKVLEQLFPEVPFVK